MISADVWQERTWKVRVRRRLFSQSGGYFNFLLGSQKEEFGTELGRKAS